MERRGETVINESGPMLPVVPESTDWSTYLGSGEAASEEFMEAVEELPVQERELA